MPKMPIVTFLRLTLYQKRQLHGQLYEPTVQPTDRRTDTTSYRDAYSNLPAVLFFVPIHLADCLVYIAPGRFSRSINVASRSTLFLPFSIFGGHARVLLQNKNGGRGGGSDAVIVHVSFTSQIF